MVVINDLVDNVVINKNENIVLNFFNTHFVPELGMVNHITSPIGSSRRWLIEEKIMKRSKAKIEMRELIFEPFQGSRFLTFVVDLRILCSFEFVEKSRCTDVYRTKSISTQESSWDPSATFLSLFFCGLFICYGNFYFFFL